MAQRVTKLVLKREIVRSVQVSTGVRAGTSGGSIGTAGRPTVILAADPYGGHAPSGAGITHSGSGDRIFRG